MMRYRQLHGFDFLRFHRYSGFMESLHAPWRIEYILAPKPQLDASLFTRIAQSNDDEANRVIVRDRTCFALLNTYPYNGGHLLIVPYKQVADLNGLTAEELADLWKLTRRCINALTQVMKPDGFNIGINLGKVAGAGQYNRFTSGAERGCRQIARGTGKIKFFASENAD